MSRSGYSDCDGDNWALIRWRGAVKSAIRGAKGQAMLKEALAALDAMQNKRLASESLVNADGEFCTLGALGYARGLDMSKVDPEDREAVASLFGVAEALAAEIMFLNDEFCDGRRLVRFEICGPMRHFYPHWEEHNRSKWMPDPLAAERRWEYMRNWVASQIVDSETNKVAL